MWSKVTFAVLLGYLCMGRTFAYLGIPSLHIFVGEVLLAFFLVCGPRTARGRLALLPINTGDFRRYKKWLLIFLVYGMLQVLRGVYQGYSPMLAARDLAMNYYPLYFALGLWVGLLDAEYLGRLFRFAAWTNGIYGLLFIVVLSRFPWSITGFSEVSEPVQLFGQPSFSAAILLGLICYEKDLRAVWIPLCMNVLVLLGMLIRAEWVGFALGLLLWACFSRNLRKLAIAGTLVAGVLALMYWTNFSYEGPATRGGKISAADIVGRIMAPVNPDLAKDYTEDVQQFEGNAVWRTLFWSDLWTVVHDSRSHELFGLGYGYPLNNLQPFGADTGVRTPHSVFFWILGFTGWTGVIIFVFLQLSLGRLLLRVYRRTRQPFGLVFLVAMMAFASFTPFFEVPQGAIPFYLIAGCACASLLTLGNQSVCAPEQSPPSRIDFPGVVSVKVRLSLSRDGLVSSE